jgi:hypothetical protein
MEKSGSILVSGLVFSGGGESPLLDPDVRCELESSLAKELATISSADKSSGAFGLNRGRKPDFGASLEQVKDGPKAVSATEATC